jgi:simple sugar transport system ATP-binding protein
MWGITKQFPGVLADDHVNLFVEKGEIHAIVGENGAGKTTLMRILCGLERQDRGEIFLDKKKVNMSSPQIAVSLGIGMVHQHFQLIPSFTVAENVVLNFEPRRNVFFDRKRAIKDVRELSKRFEIEIDPERKVTNLSVGERQRIEILKLLYREANILIFDEPTAVLTPQETEILFDVMRRLVNEGRTIIFITHKLKEVFEVSSYITVMRRGRVTGVLETNKTNEREISRLMFGGEISAVHKDHGTHIIGKPVLKVKDIEVLEDRGLLALKGVSFEVQSGEILGVAGVEGNGQKELIEAFAGVRPVLEGNIFLESFDVTYAPVCARRKLGLSIIPPDRNIEGLSLLSSISDNLISTRYHYYPFSKAGILRFNIINPFVYALIKRFNIKSSSPYSQAKVLSGGNLQRVVVARELATMPKLLIAAHPTRGLDASSTNTVHQEILTLSSKGVAIILISSDLDEILELSDRILVLYQGKILGELDISKANRTTLGMLMTGHTLTKEVESEFKNYS